jgi:hypothetical protein
MEVNFGFEVTSIAGMQVPPKNEEQEEIKDGN